jgi:hypothetical protein
LPGNDVVTGARAGRRDICKRGVRLAAGTGDLAERGRLTGVFLPDASVTAGYR